MLFARTALLAFNKRYQLPFRHGALQLARTQSVVA